VVASPKPAGIKEIKSIELLMESGHVVIACGGGGIPVAETDGTYRGMDAVIDKDFAAAKLAELINADTLFILTAVERASINFRKPDERPLSQITVDEAKRYCEEGHFAPGSMLPKIEAGIAFVSGGSNRKAVIGLLAKAAETISGENGTTILPR
jgi:carbamate kinase